MFGERALFKTRYWHGQRLEADDLRRQEHTFEQVRWWHNRAMHDAVGVTHGLEATFEAGPPPALKVSPGLAYDGYGRELVIAADTRLPVPTDVADGALLVLLWTAPELHASCDCGCHHAMHVSATLSWVSPLALSCAHVVLGQLRDGVLDRDFRPLVVRPLRRPQLATGETSRTNTPWEPWIVTGFDQAGRLVRKTVGIQTRVDTTAAGFIGVPHYFARHLWNQTTGEEPDRFSPAFAIVDDPRERRFTYRLLMEGIVRQAVDIAAPQDQIEELDFRQTTVTLSDAHGFLVGDLVVRLDPTSASLARVTTIDDDVLTLSAALSARDNEEQTLAWTPDERTARIENIKASQTRVQVNAVAGFAQDDVVVRVTRDGTQSNASRIERIDGSIIILAYHIEGLQRSEELGRVRKVAAAVSVSGLDVVIDTPGAIAPEDIVVLMSDNPQLAKPSTVAAVSNDRTTVTLSTPIAGLAATSVLGVVTTKTEVSRVTRRRNVVVVDTTAGLREGDLVGAVNGRAITELTQISRKELTLSERLDELVIGGRLGVVMLTERYTVREVSDEGRRVRIASDSAFRNGDALLRVDEDRTISLRTTVRQVEPDGWLTLAVDRSDLSAGHVVSLGRLPVAVTVDAVAADGLLHVSPGDVVRTGDLIRDAFDAEGLARTERVREAAGRTMRLRRPLPNIGVDDVLTLLAPMQTVRATPQENELEWTVPDGSLFRVGDAIGRLGIWRSAVPYSRVQRVTGSRLLIDQWPDGVLPADWIGFADFARSFPAAPTRDNTILRLASPEQVVRGERIVVSGLNERTGRGVQLDALVVDRVPDTALVELGVTADGFVLRPESLSAAALYNPRFADLFAAYARKQGLYVAWLGCQHHDTTCPEEPPLEPCCRERKA
jgi:hypothetical protein